MKPTTLWIAVIFALVLGLQQSTAGTVLGTSGQKCYSTNFRNFTAQPCISVFGNWIENIDRATTSASGVSVKILGKFNGAQNNSGSFAGKGRVDLDITTTNAAAGNATINLINDPDFGIGGETFTFTVSILAPPTVTSVDAPTPADPFNNITVTLHGTGLQEAKDPASGTIVQDEFTPFITVGGNASISNVRILNSSATSLQAQIFFSALVQDATVELSLRSNNACVPLGVLPKPVTNFRPFTTKVHTRSSNIKNYVKSITFPNGNTFDKNSIATIHINLLFPAPADGARIVQVGGRNFTVANLAASGNRTVFFKLVPANAFAAVPNGTPVNATGLTRLEANVGDNIIPITLKIADCLGGQPGTTNTVKIQTWMHNTNTTLPPDFVEQTFLVRCIQ